MGHHSIIYGRICGAFWKTADYYKLHRLNQAVISSLPERDETFPFINQSMFSIPNEQGIYRDQIITFGASYKTLEYEWHLWLDKFEAILRRLYWFDVEVKIEFEMMGDYTYTWLTDLSSNACWYEDPPRPNPQWIFEADGPRSFLDKLR